MCSTLNFGGLVKQSFDFCPKSPNAKFTTGSIKCSRRTLHRRSRRPYTLTPLSPYPRLISTGGAGGARRAARRGFSGVITMLPGITHQGRITSPLTAFT